MDYSVKQIENSKKIILIISSRKNLNLDGVKIIFKWKPKTLTNFKFGSLENIPKLILVDNAFENVIALKEAKSCSIRTISICDTNCSLVNIGEFIRSAVKPRPSGRGYQAA